MPHSSGRIAGRSVFRTITNPLLFLVFIEALLLVAVLLISGVVGRLDRNAEDLLGKQVENRAAYLENSMVINWSDLAPLAETINTQAQSMLADGTLTLDRLSDSSDACAPLLLGVMDDLVSTLYAKRVSGIFIIFNSDDLADARATGHYPSRTGVYIRDMDPDSSPPAQRSDLLLERAPISVVKSLNISTDFGWQPQFAFSDQYPEWYYDFFYQPFQAAYTSGGVTDPADYGYWSASPFVLQGSTLSSISYSIPLVLEDGTVYGVLGVDLLTDYLRGLLPAKELSDNEQGSYLLGVQTDGDLTVFPTLLSSSSLLTSDLDESIPLTPMESGYTAKLRGATYYIAGESLSLYSRNAPFENQQWVLLGMVPTSQLYAFSQQMVFLLALAILLTLLAGFLGSILIGRRLSTPIRRLSKEVDLAQAQGGIPHLSATGIREIDRFASAITNLSRDVVDASTRFLRIMEMASIEIGGFEIRNSEETVFVTDNFFPLLGIPDMDPAHVTVAQFRAKMAQLTPAAPGTGADSQSKLYQVTRSPGVFRYVRVEISGAEDRRVGLAEDVTAATMERLRIEHDRDYDLLTGLLNRRAFYRAVDALFLAPEQLGHAAVVMLDLDNLKRTNDRFGHEWGDQYIRRAARCFVDSLPQRALCSRISGDEFLLFLFGYSCREDIRTALDHFSQAVRDSAFVLPSGENSGIRVSGGVSWYPEDGRSFQALMKFADFAMYQVKQTQKGKLGEFDLGVYNHEIFLEESRLELRQLLEEEQLTYHFQPIVDAATGQIRAYEALMRLSMHTLHTPAAVLQLAREEGRLQEVERLTWFKSSACYQSLLDQGLVAEDALLFINSIASQSMKPEEQAALLAQYPNLRNRYVIEITEAEDMDPAATRRKREAAGSSGRFALDDYGSGYNSEKNLLELEPQFIKVDISMIRDIDSDLNKQHIVSNLVDYARGRGMQTIAEGLETAGEVRTVLSLGVDLLQGYFLAPPSAVPTQIAHGALEIIRTFPRPATSN